MNERIKVLWKQAESHTTNTSDLRDRFAELIVRECANVILEWKSEPFPYDPEFGAKLIKEHFGVES